MPKHFQSRPVLLIAFAFAVMGALVASVAFAIEAALPTLGAHLELLLPTMALVIGDRRPRHQLSAIGSPTTAAPARRARSNANDLPNACGRVTSEQEVLK